MLMSISSFVQAVAISYETMTFDEVMRLPNSQRIAMMRVRRLIKQEIDKKTKTK